MKVAVIGSRNVFPSQAELASHLADATEIVSGGARGVDSCAARFARENGLKLTEFLPKYELFGRGAPLKRNEEIVNYADRVLAFWDGKSRGTLFVINYAKKHGKECEIVLME